MDGLQRVRIVNSALVDCARKNPGSIGRRGNRMRRYSILLISMSALLALNALSIQTAQAQPEASEPRPALINTCLITADVKKLVTFYESVLQQKAQWSGVDYAEFRTGVGVLTIFSAQAQERYIPGSAVAANNRGIILEFKVDDVDVEFRRLHSLVKTWVKPPTTQPWGTRSFYFRDPDGNLVDFFSRPTAHKT
jgi:catechol 2,3-dioxygenase-like lactoylglutathione lyase family enzyme